MLSPCLQHTSDSPFSQDPVYAKAWRGLWHHHFQAPHRKCPSTAGITSKTTTNRSLGARGPGQRSTSQGAGNAGAALVSSSRVRAQWTNLCSDNYRWTLRAQDPPGLQNQRQTQLPFKLRWPLSSSFPTVEIGVTIRSEWLWGSVSPQNVMHTVGMQTVVK